MTEHELLVDGSSRFEDCVILAHGAGAPMDSEFMDDVAVRLAATGVRVVRFEFPYMAERRATGRKRPPNTAQELLTTYREVIEQVGEPSRLVIGGKSMGGRIASMVADAAGVRGLACLGYPFHPPGRPEKLRTEHLEGLKTNTIIVQGERDGFGARDEIKGYSLSRSIRFAWIPDGDHSFRPRVRSGHTLEENITAGVDAIAEFLATL
jgi:uncharacterized protein